MVHPNSRWWRGGWDNEYTPPAVPPASPPPAVGMHHSVGHIPDVLVDGVEFRVFTLFLSLASPFFETLFGLPQTLGGATNQEMKDGLAVITVSEDSKTLDSFLRFCYPSTLTEDPSLENLTDALSVLAAARKYSLDLIEIKGLKHETITAARHTLRQPLIPGWCAEIDLITASDLLTLLTYHKKSRVAANGYFVQGTFTEAVAVDGVTTNDSFYGVMDSPSGDIVRTAADRTVGKVRAAGCTACSGQVKENMAEFSNQLAQKVEEVVASIELEMDF
ncbi:hypothetical protein BDR05DRAFT_1057945 [Suillus weaverae]|nr:hypothetical protein BDR05DRAFT_1057945 [Suillus weaverae]